MDVAKCTDHTRQRKNITEFVDILKNKGNLKIKEEIRASRISSFYALCFEQTSPLGRRNRRFCRHTFVLPTLSLDSSFSP